MPQMGGSDSCLQRDMVEYERHLAYQGPFQGRIGRWVGGIGRTCGCWDDVLDNQEPVLGRPEVWRPGDGGPPEAKASPRQETSWPSWRTVDATTAYMEQRSSRLRFGAGRG
mmetsp:Transcript_33286/g.77554  ORF Transcript_33286/g.77554 Transcript_33286/m.77554 type:complete len:111 (-) Transcript_33286:73-405(-)